MIRDLMMMICNFKNIFSSFRYNPCIFRSHCSFYNNKIYSSYNYLSFRYFYSNDKIITDYIDIRVSNPRYTFDNNQIELINHAFNNNKCGYNSNASFINPNPLPISNYEQKDSDAFMIRLWNIIFPDANINSIDDIKESASDVLTFLDNKYPSGVNMNAKELMRYITAHSASSFIGIQKESHSLTSLNSMKKTLSAHANYDIRPRPWLINNLEDCQNYIRDNNLMHRCYGDVCLSAKSSRTSIIGDSRMFRDYVFETSYDDIINNISSIGFPPYIINAGKRNDRRGKFRLICSFHANIRILDFLINNGSYNLFTGSNFYSNYTTEGLSGLRMWEELALMSVRDNSSSMICLDFKGYDSQISMNEYIDISTLLNRYRINVGDEFSCVFDWFIDWLKQPKFLVSEGLNGFKDILLPYYRTLASGLHGTHSFENLIGISFMREAEKRGFIVRIFKANGDDQNIMIDRRQIDDFLHFASEYFDIEFSKSLIDHQLTVWGKKWFTRAEYPVPEIGTIRSLWEREGGSSNFVEPSKFENNYCKIINLIIFLYRLEVDKSIIIEIMKELCHEVGINYDRLPYSVNNLSQIKSGSTSKDVVPVGLESCKTYLSDLTIDANLVGARNVYELLKEMYVNRKFYDMNVSEVLYYPVNTEFSIESNIDYSVNTDDNIPWMLRDMKIYRFTEEQNFVKSILQGTNSFDGACDESYVFTDMYSLAMCIHERNLRVWNNIQSKL